MRSNVERLTGWAQSLTLDDLQRKGILVALPCAALAFVIGFVFELLGTERVVFDLVAYTLGSFSLLSLMALFLARRITFSQTYLFAMFTNAGFLFTKLFYLLAFYRGANLHAQLTESFFWVPALFLFASFLPDFKRGQTIGVTLLGLMTLSIVGYVLFTPAEVRQASVTHALIQLTLANATFLGVAIGFALFRDRYTHSRARLEVAEELAHTDLLTQIPNRLKLHEEIARAVRKAEAAQSTFGLFFVDLDGFKAINDTLGHEVGDALIVEVAARLDSYSRQGDVLARISGDEFVLLLPCGTPEEALKAAERLRSALAEPFIVMGKVLGITASIGVSLYPEDGADAETLLRHADMAMYQVKLSGKNGFKRFEQAFEADLQRRRVLQQELKTALQRGEFRLVYQPLFDLGTHELVKVEALLRWNNARLGEVSPGEFIPVAEATGAINEINRWVLFEACRQLGEWQRKGPRRFSVAVNISPVLFAQPDFQATVMLALHEANLAPHYLELEVTEGVLIENLQATQRLLHALNEHRVSVAIDDFGTGYSSLAYLKDLKVQTLKIDRSFISDLSRTHAASRSTMALFEVFTTISKTLDMQLVAEGIETQEQYHILQSLGVNVGQGYFFAKPLESEACRMMTLALPDVTETLTGLRVYN